MEIKRKHIFSLMIILIIAVSTISMANAYVGTGFSHDIPSSKYDGLSASDILNSFNNTECHVEESAICTKVVDGDTIYLDNGKKIRFVGVNTPERGVEGYITSKNFVQKLCLNKEVGIDIDDSKHNDKYGRTYKRKSLWLGDRFDSRIDYQNNQESLWGTFRQSW